MTGFIGWLLGFDDARSIDSVEVGFVSRWASGNAFAVVGVCVLAICVVILFYRRFETCKSTRLRTTLTTIRATALCLLLITLAAPLVHSSASVQRRPLVQLLLDDSKSMSLPNSSNDNAGASRTDQLRQLFDHSEGGLVERLQQRGCRVELLRVTSDESSPLEIVDRNAAKIALNGDGEASPIAQALIKASTRSMSERPAAMIAFSDFADTSNAALHDNLTDSMSALGTPIHAVGLGPTDLTDVSIDVLAEEKSKLGEPTKIVVAVEQSGFDGDDVSISLEARQLHYDESVGTGTVEQIAEQAIRLDKARTEIEFSYTPRVSGAVGLTAKVERLDGELLTSNNRANRQMQVIADHLRVMYVDYEPNWEWRHIKDIVARDKLVGRDGFRTFLSSAATSVRGRNDLFNAQLELPRSEFLDNDVIFIGDVPREALTTEFCKLTEEFVSQFGGGLIVVAGPRFGPSELADTPIAKMLPVILEENGTLHDEAEFQLNQTDAATRYPFMQLADSDAEDSVAWNNLGPLPWYQPVAAVHEQADVVAEHPSDLCDNGKTRQPLIAIRPYGRGQVVYVGFNEMWRLRKTYGNRYYQRFWSQLVYRLGMSHAVGSEKRFVVDLDRVMYDVEDEARISVDAFDADYQPLGLSQLTNGEFVAQLHTTQKDGESTYEISIPAIHPGRFEALLPLAEPGDYTVAIADPITERTYERSFVVVDASVEMRQIVRNTDLQHAIAEATGGRAYDVSEVDRLLDELELEPTVEQEQRQIALWATPAWFVLIVGLLLSEWTIRKLAFLR